MDNTYERELQEKHRLQLKKNRDKVMERKRRTRRLIVRGAISEAVLSKTIDNIESLSDEEFKAAMEAALNRNMDKILDPRRAHSSCQA